MEQELRDLSDESGLGKRVRIQVSQALSEGVPTVTEIALRLGMSGRTLQRRLADQSLSFKALVDESRRELAERLLKETDYALNEIAFLTGFSEQSAFNRAFKRWGGQTPRSYRLGS
ncbi:MAG: helix-turn-helix transcriptional regulator [Verrucomicrobiota bacterium JB023]|nr:helix-turn-helix transcriptional regulator [Verrucomicrobiota bacterium JB023]